MNVKSKDIIYLLFIVLIGCFFIFYKWNIIPPAIHFDQLNPFIVDSLRKSGELNISIRTQIFNWVNLITPLNILVEYFRFKGNLDGIDFILKLPSMIFFLLSIPTWFFILKEIKVKSQLPFWIIFLTSPLFILYSKFVPTVSGMFFYSSLVILFLLKANNKLASNKSFFTYLLLSLFFSVLASFTHVIAIPLNAIFFIFFLVISRENSIALRFKKINKGTLGFILYYFLIVTTIFIFALGCYASIKSGEESISNRTGYTIVNKSPEDAIKAVVQRILLSLDPRYLITGTNQVNSNNKLPLFQEFLNPNQSIWLIQLVGPFGLITLLSIAYFFITQKKALGNKLVFVLFLSYLVLAAISNFDNPSTARTSLSLMFLPLSILLLYNSIDKKVLKAGILILCLTSTVYTMFVMYSPNYLPRESAKFEVGIKEIVSQIKTSNNLANSTIFINSNIYSQTRYFQIYLGTNIANRISEYKDTEVVKRYKPKSYESVFIITENENDLASVSYVSNLSLKKYGQYYFAKKSGENKNSLVLFNDIETLNLPNKLLRKEESDIYKYNQPLSEFSERYSLFTTKESVKSLMSDLEKFQSTSYTYIDLQNININDYTNTAEVISKEQTQSLIKMNQNIEGWGKLNFNFKDNNKIQISFFDENTQQYLPFFSEKDNDNYSYYFYTPKDSTVIINISIPSDIAQSFFFYDFSITHTQMKNTITNSQDFIELNTKNICDIKYLSLNKLSLSNTNLYINNKKINAKRLIGNGIVTIWELPGNICLSNSDTIEERFLWMK